ncbi:MAG: hypothetical protein JW395_3602 [Nitrospira sp.]|nr:hypothetical protein [Nitrospira sp.]
MFKLHQRIVDMAAMIVCVIFQRHLPWRTTTFHLRHCTDHSFEHIEDPGAASGSARAASLRLAAATSCALHPLAACTSALPVQSSRTTPSRIQVPIVVSRENRLITRFTAQYSIFKTAAASAWSYVLLVLGLRLRNVSVQVLIITQDPVKHIMLILTDGPLPARNPRMIPGHIIRRFFEVPAQRPYQTSTRIRAQIRGPGQRQYQIFLGRRRSSRRARRPSP